MGTMRQTLLSNVEESETAARRYCEDSTAHLPDRLQIAKSRASPAVARCMAVRVRSSSNISWSSVQNGALAEANLFALDATSEIATGTARSFAVQDTPPVMRRFPPPWWEELDVRRHCDWGH